MVVTIYLKLGSTYLLKYLSPPNKHVLSGENDMMTCHNIFPVKIMQHKIIPRAKSQCNIRTKTQQNITEFYLCYYQVITLNVLRLNKDKLLPRTYQRG
jgi:hypothetical protein